MKTIIRIGVLALAVIAVGACSSDRADEADGGVILEVSDFDERPFGVSVNNAVNVDGGFVTIGEVTISSIVANPEAPISDLMTAEISTYEVRYRRVDSGTVTPSPYVRSSFGVVPPGGSLTFENLPILGSAQLLNPPLSDLLFENGGFDKETGNDRIVLDLTLTFFGETVGGDEVATAPVSWTIEFLQ